MPMIDITVPAGLLDTDGEQALLARLTEALLRWENATGNALVTANTGAYLHVLPAGRVQAGGVPDAVVRVGVLTPARSLSQAQRQGFTAEATELVATLTSHSTSRARTWVLWSEAVDGGWGLGGQALTTAAIAEAVRGAAAGVATSASPRST